MPLEFVQQLVRTEENDYYGRVRTYRFLEEYLLGEHDHLPLGLVPTPLFHLSPSVGWDFIRENSLERVVESEDDEGIVSQFLHLPLAQRVRKELGRFLKGLLPGPLVLEGICAGEDMGVTLPLAFSDRCYVMDPGGDERQRVAYLERAIKSIWAKTFTQGAKAFMGALELPLENWMPAIALTVPCAPRRGSFYYPDITAVVWGGEGVAPGGFTVGGWWEPRHPQFPRPVPFVPGEPIGPGVSQLLALEAKPGERPLTRISRHLAKTHGTRNLTVVKEDRDTPKRSKPSSLIEGEGAPFTIASRLLVEEVGRLLGEPVVLQLALQPNRYTGEPELFVTSVLPYLPKRFSQVMSRPTTDNVEYLFDSVPARGHGSGFIRYVVRIEQELSEGATVRLERFLTYLTCQGETALLIAHGSCPEECLLRLASQQCVVGLFYKQYVLERSAALFQLTTLPTLQHRALVPLEKWREVGIDVCPKPVTFAVEEGQAVAWV